ncbi:MAG: hypothetical protein ABL921_27830 [Pirellula sp.]
MTHSIQEIHNRQIFLVVTVMVVAIVGCSSPQSRKLADSRIRLTPNAISPPQNNTGETPVLADRESSPITGSVVLAAASVFAITEQSELRKPSVANGQNEKERSDQKTDGDETGDREEDKVKQKEKGKDEAKSDRSVEKEQKLPLQLRV